MMKLIIEGATLELIQGDLTQQAVAAIVNAANSSLMGGGGVDGAIHRAGGSSILEACKTIRQQQGSLPTGQAVITPGGQLPATHVIHTVGPIWQGGYRDEEELLRRCYRSSLALARQHQLRSIAFPSISTGAYHYPIAQAARIALSTVADELAQFPGAFHLVRFVLFDDETLTCYKQTLAKIITLVDSR